MKKILLGALLLLSTLGFSQESYNRDLICSNEEKTFSNILIWVAESFNDSNSVIKMKDKESGIIVIKGIIENNGFKTLLTIRFTITNDKCNVLIKDWKEEHYGYQYKDISNCYTNACRKNVEKWSSTVDLINEKIIDEITKTIKN